MNHKAHFKGDVQVDGFILDSAGNPIGGDGADLLHLTQLGFGDPTDLALWRSDDGYLNMGVPSQIDVTHPAAVQVAVDASVTITGGGVGHRESWTYLDPTGFIEIKGLPAADLNSGALSVKRDGDANSRFQQNLDGSLHWGSGAAAPDVALQRYVDGGNGALLLRPGSLLNHNDTQTHWTGIFQDSMWAYHDGWNQGIGMIGYTGIGGRPQMKTYDETHEAVVEPGYMYQKEYGVHRFVIDNGVLSWGNDVAAQDTTFRRAAAGIVEVAEHGGGLRLYEADGTPRTLTVAGGVLVVT